MWYVIWTTTGKEEETKTLIARLVSRDAYRRCVIPYRAKMEKRDGVWTSAKKLLFPSYLFVEADDEQIPLLAEQLKSLPAFGIILRTGDHFHPLDPHEAAILTRLIGDGETVDVSRGYIEGDRIVVVSGPLVGLEGEIKKIDRHKRTAAIEMTFMNRTTRAIVGLEVVRKS